MRKKLTSFKNYKPLSIETNLKNAILRNHNYFDQFSTKFTIFQHSVYNKPWLGRPANIKEICYCEVLKL